MLSPFMESDITADYIGWLNDPEVVRFSNQRFRHHDRRSCTAYLNTFSNTGNLFLAIRSVAEARMVGTMTAYIAVNHGTADLGLMIGDRSLWGHGWGREAWCLLMGYLFETHGLRKVTGGAVGCNIGMVRIMEHSGMHLEATRIAQEVVEGVPQDVLCFAKFRSE